MKLLLVEVSILENSNILDMPCFSPYLLAIKSLIETSPVNYEIPLLFSIALSVQISFPNSLNYFKSLN